MRSALISVLSNRKSTEGGTAGDFTRRSPVKTTFFRSTVKQVFPAITRAMQTLTLSHCVARKKYGIMTPCHPSPFLREIPPDLLESSDAKAKEPVSVETGKNLFAAMRLAAGN
jgi:hypothetical protein